MTNIDVSFQHCITNIRFEIFQILSSYKQVVVHKAKLAALCQQLNEFHKYLGSRPPEKRSALSSELQSFKSMTSSFSSLRSLLFSLSESNFLKTILAHKPDYVASAIDDFRRVFVTIMTAMKIVEIDPLPVNYIQQTIDECADLEHLIHKLEEAKVQSEEIEEKITQIGERINFLKCSQDELTPEQIEQRRILPSEEIEEKMKKFINWKLKHEDLILIKPIGSGGYADVYNGYHKPTGRVVAIKKLHNNDFSVMSFESFYHEVDIMSNLDHFAILPFVGVCWNYPFYIVTEFMSGGSLFDRLHSKSRLLNDPTKLTIIALGVAQGMANFHSKKMIHRDLKSLNILLDADDFPRICDFGMAIYQPKEGELLDSHVGTSQWMAPEVLSSQIYDSKIDVYSYGILLWEMLTHDIPYKGMKESQIAKFVVQDDGRPLVPQNCPPKLKRLIRLCWDKNPEKRPCFQSIASAFELGEISFQGTNQSKIQSYISQVQYDNNSITSEPTSDLESLIRNLTNNDEKAIQQIIGTVKEKTSKTEIIKSGLIQKVPKLIENCSSPSFSFHLIRLVNELISDDELKAELFKNTVCSRILNLYLKFGTTTMKDFLNVFQIALETEKIKVSTDQFVKLSNFLVANDLSLRLQITTIFLFCIDNSCFESESALSSILTNVVRNIDLETMPELLSLSLKIIEKLIKISNAIQVLNRLDTATRLVPLYYHTDPSVLSYTLKLISILIDYEISMQFISAFSKEFPVFFPRLAKIYKIPALTILKKLYIASKVGEKEINENYDIRASIYQCINSHEYEVVIYTLQLTFTIISNLKDTMFKFQDLIVLLASNHKEIVLLSAACICQLITIKDMKNECFDNLEEILIKMLNQSDDMQLAAVRVIGTLSTNKVGSNYLSSTKLISAMNESYSTMDNKSKSVAIMAFASYSNSNPGSADLIKTVPLIINQNEPSVLIYIALILSNISITSEGSKLCVENIEVIIKFPTCLKKYTLATLENVSHYPQSLKLLDDQHIFEKLIVSIKQFRQGEWSRIVFNIYEKLSTFEAGRKALLNQNVMNIIEEMQASLPLSHTLMPLLDKIYSRLR